jgi:hypothetical protein
MGNPKVEPKDQARAKAGAFGPYCRTERVGGPPHACLLFVGGVGVNLYNEK